MHQPLRSDETFTQYTGSTANYSLETNYTYDAYGNVTLTAELGDSSSGDDDVYVCTRYLNDSATGRYGYEQQSKIGRTLAGCQAFIAASDPDAITWVPSVDLRWSKTGYDANMNPTSKSHYDDSNSVFLTDSFTFDAYGNILSATNAASETTTYTYDSTYHSFRTTITSPQLERGATTYKLTTSTVYDAGFGVLLSTKDPNGNLTTQTLDGFGRPVAVYGPDDDGTSTQLVTTTWVASGGAYYLETRQRPDWSNDDTSTWYWDRQYYDGLDRVYRTERSGLKNSQPTTIASDTGFDTQGRVSSTTAPYFVGDPAPTTNIEYDIYNRPTLSTDPSGMQVQIDYADGGRKVTRTTAYDTPDAQTEVTYLTGRGLLQQQVAPNGTTSTYVRDPLGQVTSISTAPLVRTTTITYDSIGRRRTLENSNTGSSTWSYDTTGTLTRITDGAGNRTDFTAYDAMGRLLQRSMTYTGGTGSTTYTYDDPAYTNGLGNLTSVAMSGGAAGTFSYSYGYTAYGQAKAGTMTIAGDQYVYGSSYDPLGRIISATYPSGDLLGMSYLTDSTLGSVSLTASGGTEATTYATYANYTALGQPQQVTYNPSNITVATTYFPIGQAFPQLQTAKATQGGNTLYSKRYTWNGLKSLTGITDLQNAASNETYGYDDQAANLHMGFLTSATGPYDPQSYSYDTLGNVSSKTGVSMTYADGKDWLTGTSSGTTFAYYANGNLQTATSGALVSTYTYDSGGLLVQVDQAGNGNPQAGYVAYDASGRRVFYQRVGDTQKTYWITEQFEVVDLGNGSFQHTLYVPGTVAPLAAITSTGKGNSTTEATRAALDQLYDPRTLQGQALRSAHAALAAAPVLLRHGAGVALASLGLACMLFARRRRDGLESRRAFYSAITPLVVLCFLASTLSPSYAALAPGANGSGVPTTGTQFFLPNQLESTVLVTDGSGTVTATIAYTPDGGIDQANSSGTDDFRAKFIGSEWDPTTALYQMGVRYYSPSLGRFISPDPAGQFASPYVYAGNDPVSAIDPDGEFAFAVAMIIGAIVGTYFGGATVNHDMNPLNWNWRSGKTYAGLLAGAAVGAVGAAAGGLAVEAGVAIGASGGLAAEAAGTAIGIAGQALVGAGENAAFTALGGGSAKDVVQAAGEGALFGAAFATAGEALGGAAAQFARRSSTAAEGAEDIAGAAARRESNAVEEIADEVCSASFVAGTPVVGAAGEALPIERVRVGDRLPGKDLPRDAAADGTVTQLVRHETDSLVTITFADGDSLTTTPTHAFRGYKRGWIPAKDLGAGSLLDGADGKPVEVASVNAFRPATPTTVYNFEVAGTHSYRVGADGALVHNPSKARVCRARIDKYGVVTEEWNVTELQRRFPSKAQYQAIQRDIRAKARNANKIIKSGKISPKTRVSKPVRTASKEWVRFAWAKKFGTSSTAPSSVRAALAKLRPHFANQDVDEYLTRIQGGLTIREGLPENQGPLNSFVNQTSGAAMGALSRAGPPQAITSFKPAFVKF
ncbi:RHS repeat-associated core domain protein [compost metagenome]